MTDKDQRSPSGFEEIGELVNGKRISRRSLIKGAAAMGAVAALGPIAAACGSSSSDTGSSASPAAGASATKGGDLMVGIVGGSAKDTADPHTGSYEPDIAIQYIMYEGLTAWDFDMNLTNLLAETIEPNAEGTVWQVKLRDGVTWHDGKPLTADDVVYSLDRIVDPKDPKVGAAALTGVTKGGNKKVDDEDRGDHALDGQRAAGREPGGTQLQDRARGLRPEGPDRQRPVQDARDEAR